MPHVTVLLAVRDGEAHLREALESVLSQTYTDLELLVVDDGSTDRSREIVRSYDDARVRMIENDRNLGLAKSLNRGLALSQGELVARLDADDVCEPDRIARQVAFMEANPGTALVGSTYREIDESGHVGRARPLPLRHAHLCWALLFYCPFVHSAVMMRKALTTSMLGGYDETLTYAMDYELWRRIARRFHVANLDVPLVRYRYSSTSMTSTYGSRTGEGRSIAIAGLRTLLGWDGRDDEHRFAVLQAVLKPPPRPLDVHEVGWAIREAYRLQEVFGPHFNLTEEECAERARQLPAEIARQLLESVRQFPDRLSVRAGVHILTTAAREYPRALLSRAALAAAVKLLLRRPQVQPRPE